MSSSATSLPPEPTEQVCLGRDLSLTRPEILPLYRANHAFRRRLGSKPQHYRGRADAEHPSSMCLQGLGGGVTTDTIVPVHRSGQASTRRQRRRRSRRVDALLPSWGTRTLMAFCVDTQGRTRSPENGTERAAGGDNGAVAPNLRCGPGPALLARAEPVHLARAELLRPGGARAISAAGTAIDSSSRLNNSTLPLSTCIRPSLML